MLYLSCQITNRQYALYWCNDRKFAFVKGAGRKQPARLVGKPDNPTAKAFFIVKLPMLQSTDGFALGRAMTIIHTIAELDAAFTKAEAVASTNSWIWEQFTDNRTETMAALGLALHTELSTIYEEESV